MPAAGPKALAVADPNFSDSSQNTTRMPRETLENGTKPTLTASGIVEILRNQGCPVETTTNRVYPSRLSGSAARPIGKRLEARHYYGPPTAPLPSIDVAT